MRRAHLWAARPRATRCLGDRHLAEDRPLPNRTVTVQTTRKFVVPLELEVTRPALRRGLGHAPDLAPWMTAWQANIAHAFRGRPGPAPADI
jgi:hypothetical protein